MNQAWWCGCDHAGASLTVPRLLFLTVVAALILINKAACASAIKSSGFLVQRWEQGGHHGCQQFSCRGP